MPRQHSKEERKEWHRFYQPKTWLKIFLVVEQIKEMKFRLQDEHFFLSLGLTLKKY